MTRPLHLLTFAVRAIAFWAAVVLPLAYVPALIDLTSTALFLALIPVHTLCLFVGHEHTPGSVLASPTQP